MSGQKAASAGICYIFGAAPVVDASWIMVRPGPRDLVICADGGLSLARRAGVEPDWIVGDFDSSDALPSDESKPQESGGLLELGDRAREFSLDGKRVIRVRPEKDDTDLALAVAQGRKLGYTEFVVYGALGGRFDHSIANVQMLTGCALEGVHVLLRDRQNEVSALCPGELVIPKGDYHYFSLFSMTEECTGVTIRGAAYPLEDATLTNHFPLGVSNEVAEEQAVVSLKTGVLLVIRAADGNQTGSDRI